ncbi:MAG: hypothetical protein ACOH1R_07735 [Luteimonas sp.]
MSANLDMALGMVADGHTMEAAIWVKSVAGIISDSEARALLHVLADAILVPVPRKRGDKFAGGDKFVGLGKELTIFRAVCKLHSDGETLENAFAIASDMFPISDKTAERLYYKLRVVAT